MNLILFACLTLLAGLAGVRAILAVLLGAVLGTVILLAPLAFEEIKIWRARAVRPTKHRRQI